MEKICEPYSKQDRRHIVTLLDSDDCLACDADGLGEVFLGSAGFGAQLVYAIEYSILPHKRIIHRTRSFAKTAKYEKILGLNNKILSKERIRVNHQIRATEVRVLGAD